MDHKDEIMVTVKNKDGMLLRVPIQYAQKAINSSSKDDPKMNPEDGIRFMEEYVARLKKRTENS